MGRPARQEIEDFARDSFAVARDRILKEHADQQKIALRKAELTGNSGAYLPTLITCETQRVRAIILALADAYVKAFTLHRVPSDPRAGKDFQTAARQITAGAISGLRGHLQLRSGRLRIAEPGQGIPWHLKIERAIDAAVREGQLKLRRQRIEFTVSEGPSPHAPGSFATQPIGPPPPQGPDFWPAASPKPAQQMLGEQPGHTGGAPRRPLKAVREDQERRAQAKKDLEASLQLYNDGLPKENISDLIELAHIWGAYAEGLYDSLATSYLGSPMDAAELFGERGVLYGGSTLAQVRNDLEKIRLPRPKHWPAPQNFGEGVDLELHQTLQSIILNSPLSFSWLMGDEWFMREISKCVSERANYWKDRFLAERLESVTIAERARKRGEGATKKRGRRADPKRADAIRKALQRHGSAWRNHLAEIFEELDREQTLLGAFQNSPIELGDGRGQTPGSWQDLDLMSGLQRKQLVDALRQYVK